MSSWAMWASGDDAEGVVTGASLAGERWELVDAYWGSGSWLIAIGVQRVRVWAPPGVALSGEPEEGAGRWTHAITTYKQLGAVEAAAVVARAVGEVIADVPPDFATWVLDCTSDQIRVLGLFASTAADPDDPYALAARDLRHELLAELEAHATLRRPREQPAVLPEAYPTAVQRAFYALSDRDFGSLVSDLVSRLLKTPVMRWAPNHGDDLLLAEAQGRRYVVQVKHYGCRAIPPERLSDDVHAEARLILHRQQQQADVHWVVTSQLLSARMRHELLHALGPWTAARHRIVGGDELGDLLAAEAAVEQHHLKYRVAKAADGDLDDSFPAARAVVSRWAQTELVSAARRILQDRRMLIISGAPGAGKTSLATMLVADATVDNYEPLHLTTGHEVLSALSDRRRCVVLWDDARGESRMLSEMLGWLAAASGTLLVITTNQHLGLPAALAECHIRLGDYQRRERAHILYNHLWHAGHPEVQLELSRPEAYGAVIDHPQFTPRLVETVARAGSTDAGGVFRSPLCRPDDGETFDEDIHSLFLRMRRRNSGCC